MFFNYFFYDFQLNFDTLLYIISLKFILISIYQRQFHRNIKVRSEIAIMRENDRFRDYN